MLCIFCGRGQCRCGNHVPSIACPRHGFTMAIVSRSIWKGRGKPYIWNEYAKCEDCDYVRALKNGLVPSKKKKSSEQLALELQFGAQVRARIDYR